MKKIISLLMSLAVGILLCIPASAADSANPWWNWDATLNIKTDIANLVTTDQTIPWSTNIPEGALMVVTNGATLKIRKNFTVRGALVVHSGSKIVVQNGGSLIIAKNGAVVSEGKIAVSRGGKLRCYGDLQTTGNVAVKGVLKTYSTGDFSFSTAPRAYSGGKLTGKRSKITGAPKYYIEDLRPLSGETLHLRFDETSEETDITCSSAIIRNAAAVLYKLDRTITSSEYPSPDSELGKLMAQRYITVSAAGSPLPYGFGLYHGGIKVLTETSAKTGATTGSVYRTAAGTQSDRLFFDALHPDTDPAIPD